MIPNPSKYGRKAFQRAVWRAAAAGCQLLYRDDAVGATWQLAQPIEWADYVYDATKVPNVFEGWAFAWVEGGATVHA